VCSVYADIYKLWSSSPRSFFPFNQPWTVAFNVTDATRTPLAFVSSSPFFSRIKKFDDRPVAAIASQIAGFRLNKTQITTRPPNSALLRESLIRKSQITLPPHSLPNLTYIFPHHPCYPLLVSPSTKGATMEWTAPKHEEIDLNCEISSYANAEL
jgi:hypothetical protein